MSRRNRLGTVLRVAELREAVARGQVAAAAGAAGVARTELSRRQEVLRGSAFDSTGVDRSVAQLSLRAQAVRAGGSDVAAANAARALAVTQHTAAARQSRLLAQLVDRARVAAEAHQVAVDQRASDDSTSARQTRRSRR